MNTVEIPEYFSTLNKGKVTLYIKKDYENMMSGQDIDKLLNTCKNPPLKPLHAVESEKINFYHGRAPCKKLVMDSFGKESFIVREYWHGGLAGKVFRDYFWDGKRPLRELTICEEAKRGGIKTFEIIAIIKNSVIGPLYKCRLVTREITKTIDLIEYLLYPERNQLLTHKRQVINKLAQAVHDMHEVGIYHADLHLKNILVRSYSHGRVDVYIIDLDKSKRYKKISFPKRMKNIMRLDRSLEKLKRSIKKSSRMHLQTESETTCGDSIPQFLELITNRDKVRFLGKYLELSCSSEQKYFQNRKKFLKHYIDRYQSTHMLHRIWWNIIGEK